MSSTLVIPGDGKLFQAPAGTPLPSTGIKAFTLNGTVPTGWEWFGETSYDNPPSFTFDGGDKTVKRTLEKRNRRSFYADVARSIDLNSVQLDNATFRKIFGGWASRDSLGTTVPDAKIATTLAFVLILTDGLDNIGWYIPKGELTHGDAPEVDTENFLEIPASIAILSPDDSTVLGTDPAGVNTGLYDWYPPSAWDVAGAAVAVAPSVASVVVGATTTLTATVTPAGSEITWTSSDESVATVAGGVVTGVSAGTATITASAGGATGTSEVTVTAE